MVKFFAFEFPTKSSLDSSKALLALFCKDIVHAMKMVNEQESHIGLNANSMLT